MEAVREVGDVVVAGDVWMLVDFDPEMMAGVTIDMAVVMRSCVLDRFLTKNRLSVAMASVG